MKVGVRVDLRRILTHNDGHVQQKLFQKVTFVFDEVACVERYTNISR